VGNFFRVQEEYAGNIRVLVRPSVLIPFALTVRHAQTSDEKPANIHRLRNTLIGSFVLRSNDDNRGISSIVKWRELNAGLKNSGRACAEALTTISQTHKIRKCNGRVLQ
jgi:hypothetical protein